MLTRKPRHVSWVQAAAVPENWLTAYQALFTISELRPGQNVLIHAGASGVGLAAIQLAKSFGKAYETPFCPQSIADRVDHIVLRRLAHW